MDIIKLAASQDMSQFECDTKSHRYCDQSCEYVYH